ncbi:MAG TPA: hypothetical protein VGQ39_07085 [Pyrinomonadaceae bacterium]|jgi:hypothetical protein|nr:hypothetical protein [Pyrinomonadaceae bacterium]
MKSLLRTAFTIIFIATAAAGQRLTTETRIIPQSTAPVKINSFTALYVDSSSRYVERGIHYELEYENTSAKPIVAVEFGLVAFDIWNEFLDRTGGITMKNLSVGEKDKGEWVASRYADFSFHTGVGYVSKVRFADGEIWSGDTAAILLEMRRVQKDFDASKLKKKSDDKP